MWAFLIVDDSKVMEMAQKHAWLILAEHRIMELLNYLGFNPRLSI